MAEITDNSDFDKHVFTMRFKWLADGCKTWDEVIARLVSRINDIKELQARGATVDCEIFDDYLYYRDETREYYHDKGEDVYKIRDVQ